MSVRSVMRKRDTPGSEVTSDNKTVEMPVKLDCFLLAEVPLSLLPHPDLITPPAAPNNELIMHWRVEWRSYI